MEEEVTKHAIPLVVLAHLNYLHVLLLSKVTEFVNFPTQPTPRLLLVSQPIRRGSRYTCKSRQDRGTPLSQSRLRRKEQAEEQAGSKITDVS